MTSDQQDSVEEGHLTDTVDGILRKLTIELTVSTLAAGRVPEEVGKYEADAERLLNAHYLALFMEMIKEYEDYNLFTLDSLRQQARERLSKARR